MNNFKKIICTFFTQLKIDTLFRFVNRNKVLIVMYHGVTEENHSVPIWTQLPATIFKEQIKFLKKNYNILSLSEFLAELSSPGSFPKRVALITFDDGLENNYSVAFPTLKEYALPATIFLTTNLIGTQKLLWFDELFCLFKKAFNQGVSLDDIDGIHNSQNDLWLDYFNVVEDLKIMPAQKRNIIIDQIKSKIDFPPEEWPHDFKLLNWNQIKEMKNSHLIDFGVHTANHNIVSTLEPDEFQQEIFTPKRKLEEHLNSEITSFCFPNGRPQKDFNEQHIAFIQKSGYQLAFTTESSLFCPKKDDLFQISRKPAGNDITSYLPFFKLSTSGFWEYYKKKKLFRRTQ